MRTKSTKPTTMNYVTDKLTRFPFFFNFSNSAQYNLKNNN